MHCETSATYFFISRVKERRMAAFELASMAAASLSLTEDLGTQEYAAEALAELLTVPQIQVVTEAITCITSLLVNVLLIVFITREK